MKYPLFSILIVLVFSLFSCTNHEIIKIKTDDSFFREWRKTCKLVADECCLDSANHEEILHKISMVNMHRKNVFSYIADNDSIILNFENLEIIEFISDNTFKYTCYIITKYPPKKMKFESIILNDTSSITISHVSEINRSFEDIEDSNCCRLEKLGNSFLEIDTRFEINRSDSVKISKCVISLG